MTPNVFNVIEPTTYTIQFSPGELPKLFEVFDQEGNLYYFRHLDGKTSTINLNFPQDGYYHTHEETPFTIINQKPLTPGGQGIKLRQPDRDYPMNNIKIEENVGDSMGGTPARIFPKIGVIEFNPKIKKYPFPIKLFILLHELGHCKYSEEVDADAFALKMYLGLGYNASMAYYALSHILKESPENVIRLKILFKDVMNYA